MKKKQIENSICDKTQILTNLNKNYFVTKLENLNYDQIKPLIFFTKLENSNCDKLNNKNSNKTQNSDSDKTQFLTKLNKVFW